jgi:tetratricopeptide (TPR) repeat protein
MAVQSALAICNLEAVVYDPLRVRSDLLQKVHSEIDSRVWPVSADTVSGQRTSRKFYVFKPNCKMNRHQRRAAAKSQQTALRDQADASDTIQQSPAESHSNRGIALRAQGRIAEAIAAFRQAVQLQPDVALFNFNLGAILHECRKFDDAISAYREAIRVKPDYAEAYANLGAALRSQGRTEEAVTAQRQAIKLKPTLAPAYANLGAALNELGKLNEAASACRHAITLNPNFDVAYGNLGSVLMELGRLPESRAALQHAVQLAPRNIKHRRYLGELDPYVVGDARLAPMELLSQNATQLSVEDRVELHFALGKAYDDIGQHAKAFGHWRDGNALKRKQIKYDETTELAAFERIRSSFTPELCRTWQNAGHPASVPIFVVGMPRSGTTLIEQILASHPQVFGAGELTCLDNEIKGIRTQFGGSMPFPEVVRSMRKSDFYDLGARYLAQLAERYPAATRVVDKMPENFRVAGLIHLALPNAVIIHSVRNAVDTCLSCFSKLFTTKMSYTYDLSELGRYYRNYRALMSYWQSVLPADRILHVSYEDVVADLEGQARRIVAHCRLEWDSRCLSFHKTDRPIRTASMVQARQPIYASAIERWRPFESFLAPLISELPKSRSRKFGFRNNGEAWSSVGA